MKIKRKNQITTTSTEDNTQEPPEKARAWQRAAITNWENRTQKNTPER